MIRQLQTVKTMILSGELHAQEEVSTRLNNIEQEVVKEAADGSWKRALASRLRGEYEREMFMLILQREKERERQVEERRAELEMSYDEQR